MLVRVSLFEEVLPKGSVIQVLRPQECLACAIPSGKLLPGRGGGRLGPPRWPLRALHLAPTVGSTLKPPVLGSAFGNCDLTGPVPHPHPQRIPGREKNKPRAVLNLRGMGGWVRHWDHRSCVRQAEHRYTALAHCQPQGITADWGCAFSGSFLLQRALLRLA